MNFKKYDDAIIQTCRMYGFQVETLETRRSIGAGRTMILVKIEASKDGVLQQLQQAYPKPDNIDTEEMQAIALQRFIDDLPRKIKKYWLSKPVYKDKSRPGYKP